MVDAVQGGSAVQLARAQAAVSAAGMASGDVAAIELSVEHAAARVAALIDAATTATTYDGAKTAYDADMTQANLDTLTEAAAAAKTAADEALRLAAYGSAAQLDEAQKAVAAATAASGDVDGIVMALQTGIDTAIAAYSAAKTAYDAAVTAQADEASLDNANDLKTAADDLEAAAMTARETGALGATKEQKTDLAAVISADDAATAVVTAGTAVTVAQAAADAADVVTATDAAATKVTAIEAEAEQIVDAGIGGSVATGEMTTYSMTIARDRDGTTVTIADTGMAGDDDPKFEQTMDLGGGRTMHVRDTSEGVEEVVVVRTDIEAPKATAFAMVAGQTLDVSTDTTNDGEVGADDDTFEALAVDENSADVRALVMSDAFTAGTGAVLTFAFNDTTTPDDEAFEAAGTYNGADGTYRCNGDAACTVTLDAEGVITTMNDGWVFTPDAGATSDVADADYLDYGFWLKRTTEDGAVTYNEVETFANSSIDASTGSELNDVEGSATYEGDATGVYVRNVFTDSGEIDTATSGHFTADALLKAYFGGDDVAVNLQNTVTGTIDSFALSGGEAADAWSVNLKGVRADNENTFSGTANGGGAEGMFSGTFHGLTPETEADDDDDARVAPGVVVGEFDANFSNGSVAGGFGARKQ